jgi:hypothetical protein
VGNQFIPLTEEIKKLTSHRKEVFTVQIETQRQKDT